jgi:hypothetical protein
MLVLYEKKIVCTSVKVTNHSLYAVNILFPVKPADVECYALYVYVEIVILTDEK